MLKKKKGGGLEEDIKKIKTGNRKRGGFDPKASKNRRRTVAKPKVNKPRQIIKRKGGGMAYQLYGGSTKDFSDGNKFIQLYKSLEDLVEQFRLKRKLLKLQRKDF